MSTTYKTKKNRYLGDVAAFPKYCRLTNKQTLNVSNIIHRYFPRSDFAPAYITSYHDASGNLEFSRFNNNLLAKFYDPEERTTYFTIYGLNKLPETINAVFKYQKINHHSQRINNLDEMQYKILKYDKNLKLQHLPELDEYIISTKEHALIKDKKLKDEAMHIRSFIRNYGNDIRIIEPDLNDPYSIYQIINSWHVWDRHYRNKNNDLKRDERKHISIFLSYAHDLPTKCMLISYSGQIVGFTFYDIYEAHSCAIGHYIKVDYAFNHAFDFMVHALCSRLHSKGIEFINIENDLGIPGIRYKKQSLIPKKILKFYKATPNKCN
jgi:hypothetical protein